MTPDELARSHMHVVNGVLSQIIETLPGHVDADDLRGAGMVALVECSRRYRPERGEFLPFAWTRVAGAMKDFLRREMPMSRSEARNGEIHIGSGKQSRVYAGSRSVVSLDAELSTHRDDTETLTLADTIADPRDDFEAREHRVDVVEMLAALAPKERLVVTAAASGYMGAEIGAVLGVCESRVSQIRKDAVRKMRKAAA